MPPKAAAEPQMHRYADRLASFAKPKSRAGPRRAWPHGSSTHPLLTPANMAHAGYYFLTPGSSPTSDTCACFLCGVRLGGWAEEDDPWKEHVDRGNCAWAETVCQAAIERRAAELENRSMTYTYLSPEDLPSSTTSSLVRENTFYSKDREQCWWPHNNIPKFRPTPKTLSMAGFVFSSGDEDSNDAVNCPLCNYDVEGWEADDDPLEQHRRKHPECLFFTAAVTTKTGKPKRAPRQTTKRGQAAASQKPEEPAEIPSQTEDEPAESREPTTSRTRRAAKPRATTAITKATRRTRRAVDPTDSDDDAPVETQNADPEPDEEIVLVQASQPALEKKTRAKAKPTKPRATKARKKKEEAGVIELDDEDEVQEVAAPEPISLEQPRRVATQKPLPTLPSEPDPAPSSQLDKFAHLPTSPVNPPTPPAKLKSATASARSLPAPSAKISSQASSSAPAPAPASKPSAPLEKRAPPATSTSAVPGPSTSLSQPQRARPVPAQTAQPTSISAPALRLPKTTSSKNLVPLTTSRAPFHDPAAEAQVLSGALAARQALEEIVENAGLHLLSLPNPDSTPLSEDQMGMTLEQLVRSEMKRRETDLRQVGTRMIGAFQSRSGTARKRIEDVPTR